jgi:5-amino-6-(5-phospho-D-ribitylamino)uracil phosphatase
LLIANCQLYCITIILVTSWLVRVQCKVTIMKYKLLILDVDGTILPYDRNAMPSQKVVDAIKKASEKIHVVLATGRPLFMLENIFKVLNMTEYAIINDGAQVVDIRTGNVLYHKVFEAEDIKNVMDILNAEHIEYFINDGGKDIKATEKYEPKKPLNIFSFHKLTEKQIDQIISMLTHISGIKATKSHHGNDDKWGLIISHAEATKLHGIYEVSQLLGVKKEEIIGVGDSGNDFPLLMASGLKVAMGNALEDLKDIADYVAPSVDEDGVAEVIERFVLNEKAN